MTFHALSTDIHARPEKPVFLDMVNYTIEQEESYCVRRSRVRLIQHTPLSLCVFSILHCIMQNSG
jgi:hypothetical protein